jgi:hypothetical protein
MNRLDPFGHFTFVNVQPQKEAIPMKLKLSLMLALVILVLCSTAVSAAPAPFSMTYEQSSPGVWTYTLFNDDTTGDVIPTGLDLIWDPAQPTSYYTVTGTPDGWIVNPSYDWPAWDAFGNDPVSGDSLAGFEITAATPAPYFTAYYNVLGNDLWVDGEAMPTPEPSSMFALFSGVAGLGAMIRRRRA